MTGRIAFFCEKIVEGACFLAIIIVPLFFSTYTSRSFEPDKLSLLRTLLIFALVFFIVYKIETREKRKGIFRHSIFYAIILYVLVFFVASVFSISPYTSFFGSYIRSQGFFTLASYILLFFFIFYFFRERPTLYNLIDTAIILSFPISFYGILQYTGIDPLSWSNDITQRVVST
ncbi:MAG: hypothetical protein SV062_01080, partial [Thermodesulfobacteriota bacterium]|nr:hypothetical protein [Thermodesulfobacteriota bacterium]